RRMEAVVPSEGWGVLHLFYKLDRARADAEPGGTKRVLDAIASLESDGHQVLVFTMLGHKAELGVMALGPDVARLQAFQHELAAAPLSLEWSYVSLTERSEYTDDEERARARLYPTLPRKRAICFYPMSTRRRRELVRAPLRPAQAAHGRPRARRPCVRREGAPAHHRLDRARRLGVG